MNSTSNTAIRCDTANCPECYDQSAIVLWRSLPANETLREWMNTYIGPPKIFYPSLEAALADWGNLEGITLGD